MKILAIVFR